MDQATNVTTIGITTVRLSNTGSEVPDRIHLRIEHGIASSIRTDPSEVYGRN